MIRTTSTSYAVESFAYEKSKGQYRTRYHTQKLLKFLADPENQLETYDYEILKPSTTQPVLFVSEFIENRPAVIKRYDKKNAWHALRRTVRRSRAENCWIYANILQKLGVAIALPVAFIQEYLGAGLKGRSWYITEFVDGRSCLDRLPAIDDETAQGQQLEQIIDTLKKIWGHYIAHGDLKGSNILLAQDQAVLLDLDAMKQYEDDMTARRHIGKDVERLLRNWKKDHPHPALYELTQKKLSEAGFSGLR